MIGRLVLFLGVAVLAAANCPDPYVPLDQSRCILIDPYVSYTYDDAVAYCEVHGGQMLMFNDCETSALIFDFIRSEEGTINHHYWLGASDQTEEGIWKFLDGQPVPMGTPFWGVNEPNNGEANNCAILHYQNHHYWYDVACTSSYNVICLRDY